MVPLGRPADLPCPLSPLPLPSPQVEQELEKICKELLEVLEKHLLPEDKTSEGKVFYWKMAGDYWRYLAEFATAEDRKGKAEQAKLKYEQATKTAADENLPPTNPIRLGLALNFSVFYYEILNMPTEACTLAKTAFDDAISELDSLQEEQYKDATLIMQVRTGVRWYIVLCAGQCGFSREELMQRVPLPLASPSPPLTPSPLPSPSLTFVCSSSATT